MDPEDLVIGDKQINISDAVTFQGWLINDPDLHLSDLRTADLCADGKINVFDMILMRQMIVDNKEV